MADSPTLVGGTGATRVATGPQDGVGPGQAAQQQHLQPPPGSHPTYTTFRDKLRALSPGRHELSPDRGRHSLFRGKCALLGRRVRVTLRYLAISLSGRCYRGLLLGTKTAERRKGPKAAHGGPESQSSQRGGVECGPMELGWDGMA